jgi:signal transduction histidine kinase
MTRAMKLALPLKVVVPLVLGIIVSLAIVVYAEFGYRRLESANQQMSTALHVETTLNAALALIVDAETGQRGYLLTGNAEYLTPYNNALPKVDGVFRELRELLVQHGSAPQRESLGRLNRLTGKRLSELESAIALYKKDGMEAAAALLDTGIGRRTMDEIRTEVANMAALNRRQVAEATSRWASDIAFARLGMQSMTAFTVALLLVVWLLARRDAQQREAHRDSIVEDKQRLEELVEERTIELSELSNYLQVIREDEKTKLARDLHDELGGILVGAKMDVQWVGDRMSESNPESAAKLRRALQALDDAVQIKRRIIEDLRPTLLDNLGLSAALEWQVHDICDRSGLDCTIATPKDDAAITPQVSIALYRILQEALTNIVKYAHARHVSVDLGLTTDTVTLLIEDDGVGIADDAQGNLLSHGIAGMRQRVRALHGEFAITRRAEGGTVVEVNIPLGQRPQTAPPKAPEIA